MLGLLRDIALSFCPASVRRSHRPQSSLRVLLASTLTGILQIPLCLWLLLSGYKTFLALKAEQYGPALGHTNQTTQAWFAAVLFVEYILFHPLALLLLYLAFEGIVRFAAGLCVSEVVPSFPVALIFKIKASLVRGQARRALKHLASIPDVLEILTDGEHLRIATAVAKSRWNESLTIGIQGIWYELEREEQGVPPRMYGYFLRRAPVGKILRAYEEYDIAVTKVGFTHNHENNG